MPNWTPKQQQAIDQDGTNILVSAGAGSGKTAVLSERVIRKIKDGANIDEILILTFTKAAAYEMLLRIRDNLKKEGLTDQLFLIDKAYITTFDSFTSGIVKKYHDRLKINRNFSIVDSQTVDIVRNKLLDQIFDRYYISDDSLFSKLISDYCLKSDKELKTNILNINKALDLKYDKLTYIDNYLEEYYSDNYCKYLVSKYEELLLDKINNIQIMTNSLIDEVSDSDFISKLNDVLEPLFNSYTYDEIKDNTNISLPRLPAKSGEDVSNLKDKIKKAIDEVKAMTEYDLSYLINDYKETSNTVEIILKIIKELDELVNNYKLEHNAFEFVDIEKYAIKLVKEYPDIKEELTNSFKEIMVDEYQDTSDLQEELVTSISNHNNYMVGDIKQSIYRFRNANPNIFKEKYEKYEKEIDGIKIDLTQNFRSRDEVIRDINEVFDRVMSISYGGADYSKSHRLLFGLKDYFKKGKTNQEYSLTIKDYDIDKESRFTDPNEIEAFIIANDIKEKMNSNYQVYDKKLGCLRPIKYSDFVILISKGAAFSLYKKIFEYLNIPLTLERDVDISKNEEVSLIKNILKMIKAVKNNNDITDDSNFKYGYISLARSYLFRYDDQTIYEVVNKNSYVDTDIYKKISNIASCLDNLDLKSLILKIIDEFDFYQRLITIGDINLRISVLDKLVNLASDLMILDYDYLVFIDYLDDVLNDSHKEIKVSVAVMDPNSVRIMTIHASKGLEYPICYYAGLKNGFNLLELNANLLYSNKYGIVTANFTNGYHNTFLKDIVRNDYINEEISERIRLFYVALTRAREKMIIVADLLEDYELDTVTDRDKAKYRSFLDIINSVKKHLSKYIENVDLKKVNLTKDYLDTSEIKKIDKVSLDKIEVKELEINTNTIEDTHFSKEVHKLVTKEEKENMLFGTKIHELFELTDFKNPCFNNLGEYSKYITNFLKQDLLKNIKEANIFKEYEFYDDNSHGIIDLMLEYNDHIDIIDYKLKHIDDNAYTIQLNGYKNYIMNKTNKVVNIYLYSILDDKIKKLD